MMAAWGILFGLIYYSFTQKKDQAAGTYFGALVVSHYFRPYCLSSRSATLTPLS
jgi:hypothetical protein